MSKYVIADFGYDYTFSYHYLVERFDSKNAADSYFEALKQELICYQDHLAKEWFRTLYNSIQFLGDKLEIENIQAFAYWVQYLKPLARHAKWEDIRTYLNNAKINWRLKLENISDTALSTFGIEEMMFFGISEAIPHEIKAATEQLPYQISLRCEEWWVSLIEFERQQFAKHPVLNVLPFACSFILRVHPEYEYEAFLANSDF